MPLAVAGGGALPALRARTPPIWSRSGPRSCRCCWRSPRGAGAPLAVLRIALAAVLVLVALHGLAAAREPGAAPSDQIRLTAPAADGVRADAADAAALNRLVPYVDARVPPGRPVFVANPRHDLVRVGDTLLYVLLGRPSATDSDIMQPGVVTTAAVQSEDDRVAAVLAAGRLVVRWDESERASRARAQRRGALERRLRAGPLSRGQLPPGGALRRLSGVGAPLGVDGEPSGMGPSTSSMAAEPTVIRGGCPHDCPDTCAWEVTVERRVAEKLAGVKEHPFTRGGLCAKVNHYLERTYSPDRARPLQAHRREGRGRVRAR